MIRHRIVSEIPRVDPGVVATAKDTWTCLAGTAAGRHAVMDGAIHPLRLDWSVAGPAVTVRSEDPLAVLTTQVAADLVQPGDVVVIDAGGRTDAACLGATMAWGLKEAGAAGIVVDGAVLTQRTLVEREGIPVFARGVSAWTTGAESPGSINVPIVCGGVVVNPGDLVMGDSDGVVVLPRLEADHILQTVGRKQPYPPPSRAEKPFSERGYADRMRRYDSVEWR